MKQEEMERKSRSSTSNFDIERNSELQSQNDTSFCLDTPESRGTFSADDNSYSRQNGHELTVTQTPSTESTLSSRSNYRSDLNKPLNQSETRNGNQGLENGKDIRDDMDGERNVDVSNKEDIEEKDFSVEQEITDNSQTINGRIPQYPQDNVEQYYAHGDQNQNQLNTDTNDLSNSDQHPVVKDKVRIKDGNRTLVLYKVREPTNLAEGSKPNDAKDKLETDKQYDLHSEDQSGTSNSNALGERCTFFEQESKCKDRDTLNVSRSVSEENHTFKNEENNINNMALKSSVNKHPSSGEKSDPQRNGTERNLSGCNSTSNSRGTLLKSSCSDKLSEQRVSLKKSAINYPRKQKNSYVGRKGQVIHRQSAALNRESQGPEDVEHARETIGCASSDVNQSKQRLASGGGRNDSTKDTKEECKESDNSEMSMGDTALSGNSDKSKKMDNEVKTNKVKKKPKKSLGNGFLVSDEMVDINENELQEKGSHGKGTRLSSANSSENLEAKGSYTNEKSSVGDKSQTVWYGFLRYIHCTSLTPQINLAALFLLIRTWF